MVSMEDYAKEALQGYFSMWVDYHKVAEERTWVKYYGFYRFEQYPQDMISRVKAKGGAIIPRVDDCVLFEFLPFSV